MGTQIVSLLTSADGGGGSLLPKIINVAADYPTTLEANADTGRHYYIGGDPSVTDNDPTKTNTGQTYILGQDIMWDGVSSYFAVGNNAIWSQNGTDAKLIIVQNIDLQNKDLKNVAQATIGNLSLTGNTITTTSGDLNLNSFSNDIFMQNARPDSLQFSTGTDVNKILTTMPGSPADDELLTALAIKNAISVEDLWDRVTGTPNYLLPHTTADDIGATGARITKGWFTDFESINYPSVNGTALSDQYLATTNNVRFGQVIVDNLKLDGNTLSSSSGNINITPDNPADDIIINGHWSFDGKTLVAISDSDTTITAFAGKNITIEGVTFDGGVVASVTSLTVDNLNLNGNTLSSTSGDIIATAVENITLTAGANSDVTITAGLNGKVKIDNVNIFSSTIETSAGDLKLLSASNSVFIGDGAPGIDYRLGFNGETNNGYIKWWEDEAYFDFDHPITVDNLRLDGNTLSSTSGNLNLTPVAGSDVIIDSHWGFDGTTLTALTNSDTTITAYAGKNITIEGVRFDGATLTIADSSADFIINCLRTVPGSAQDFILKGADAIFTGGTPEDGGSIIFSTGANVSGGDDGEIYLQINDVTKFHIDKSGTLTVAGGHINNVTTVNAATYDLLVSDYILNVTYTVTGAVTSLTIPDAQFEVGRTIHIKDAGFNAGTNSITLDTVGAAKKIEGNDTLVISGDGEAISLYCGDSNNFFVF